MVEHVRVWHEAIRLHTVHLDPKNTTGHHHAHFTVFFQREFTVLRHFLRDQIEITLDVFDLFTDHMLERTAFEPCSLLLRVEDGEIVKVLGQDVDELVKEGVWLASFLHDVRGEEGVLWRDESLSEFARCH